MPSPQLSCARPPATSATRGRRTESRDKPVAAPPVAPALSPHHGTCVCGGTCPRCAPSRSLLAKADFSSVRLHPSSPEITGPARARAVTIGQDIYFHPGQYQPGTPGGDHLIAHELAHTLQTRHGDAGGSDADHNEAASGLSDGNKAASATDAPAIERNADELASGATDHVAAAPRDHPLRSPFDSESDADRTRRHGLIRSVGNASDRLIRLLRTGGLLEPGESAGTRAGVRGVIIPGRLTATGVEQFQSYTERDTRIRRIIGFLRVMATAYRTAPVPTDFSAPVSDGGTPEHYSSEVRYDVDGAQHVDAFHSASAEWTDLQAAYQRYLVSQGLFSAEYELDWLYLHPDAVVNPGAARGAPRIGGGIQTGVFMVVPDIAREPLRYWRLTGTSPTPRGSTIVEFWHDDLGYYYLNEGERIDVPSPWERTR